MSHKFKTSKSCSKTKARAGVLSTPHGEVPTPLFLPVGSQGAVKTLTPEEVESIGMKMVLSNTYHLYLRPGIEVIQGLGGLHRFMSWDGPILTDSGGYQVFSLASLRLLSEEGVSFRSHIDGSEHFFTPEGVVHLQEKLGSDIIMPLDECSAYSHDKGAVRQAMERTHRWAERSKHSCLGEGQDLYGIVQGGVFHELRRESAGFLTSLGLPGYAIGGLSIGEPKELMLSILEETVAFLPEDKPRYFMGLGSPEDIFEAVTMGVDIFDSALPTRTARNGALFSMLGRHNIENARYKDLDEPVDSECDCYTCRTFSAAYLHHLFKSRELLAYRLATIHNLRFITKLMEQMRQALLDGSFVALKDTFLANYKTTDEETRLAQKQKWLQRFG